MADAFVDIVFDGPPGPEDNGRFVEVESPPGRSIRFGEWVERRGQRVDQPVDPRAEARADAAFGRIMGEARGRLGGSRFEVGPMLAAAALALASSRASDELDALAAAPAAAPAQVVERAIHGQISRIILDTLRQTAMPLTANDVARRVMEALAA